MEGSKETRELIAGTTLLFLKFHYSILKIIENQILLDSILTEFENETKPLK
jgi:hypothetical protein